MREDLPLYLVLLVAAAFGAGLFAGLGDGWLAFVVTGIGWLAYRSLRAAWRDELDHARRPLDLRHVHVIDQEDQPWT